MEGHSYQNLVQYCQNLLLPTLVPFEHDKESQRRFKLNERRNKQNLLAQPHFRRFTHITIFRILNTDYLKAITRGERLRRRLIRY